jgi:hypothetical protein
MKKYLILLIILVGIVPSCKREAPDLHAQIDTLVVYFYADSLVLSERVKLSGIDSESFASEVDSLHRVYKISREFVNSEIEKYQKNLSTWKQFYEMLVKRLEFLRTKD